MTAIWHQGEKGWTILEPVGFEDEAALHGLVADAPQVLPLSGSPRLVILGSEVRIGGGSADLVAIEPSGRVAIIEVKLARNAEARRAVVAQILTYAAYLRGTSREAFEREMLVPHLAKREFSGLLDAVEKATQDGSVEPEAFLEAVEQSLAGGAFRLVLVLDSAPPELVRLVGYLELVSPQLTIDLVTVSRYAVTGTMVLVPQRVDPERVAVEAAMPATSSPAKGYSAKDGGADFLATVQALPEGEQAQGLRLYEWAKRLEADGLATLVGNHGPSFVTLLPHAVGHDAGLVTLVTDGTVWTWRSVFEKRAPGSIAAVEQALEGPLRSGGTVPLPSDAFLAAVRSSYVEARNLAASPPSSEQT